MKILRFTLGLVGAACFVGIFLGYTHSVWVVVIAAIGLALLCPDKEDFKTPTVPMVGPRTHDAEEGGV